MMAKLEGKFDLYHKVAKLCVDKYSCLSKNGKPKENEWTILAGFVESICTNKMCPEISTGEVCSCPDIKLKVVTLATGSKCIGTSEWCKNGSLVHDCHAEILAKRSLQLYLTEEIKLTHQKLHSVFEMSDVDFTDLISSNFNSTLHKKVKLKPNVHYHLYVSHTPCGDCSIFSKKENDTVHDSFDGNLLAPMISEEEEIEKIVNESSQALSDTVGEFQEPPVKKIKFMPDIHRTGAKCASGEKEDSKDAGSSYHTLGVLRTKPGKGLPCISHSCSDKILRWSVLGLQGNLLMPFLQIPVYLSSLVLGSCPSDMAALKRGIFSRFEDKLEHMAMENNFKISTPALHLTDIKFPYSRKLVENKFPESFMPCASSLVWIGNLGKPFVIVEGRKHGITKKLLGTIKSQVPVCRYQKMKRVMDLYDTVFTADFDKSSLTYKKLKDSCKSYIQCWDSFRLNVVPNWTRKPGHLQDFGLSIEKQ